MIARIIFPATIALLALPYFLIAQAYPEMSLQEGFGPGFFPSIIAAVVGVLALVEALTQLLHYVRDRRRDNAPGATLGIEWREVWGAGLLVAAVVATVLAVPYTGFTVAACALVFVLSIAMGMRPVWLSALVSVLVGVSIHTIFAHIFGLVIAF